MSSQNVGDKEPQRGSHSRFHITPVRRVIAVLAIFLACLLLVYSGEVARRARFAIVGNVESEGLTIFLNPADKVITQMLMDSGTYEPETTATIHDLLGPGDTFIDVGANIGWFTLIASREVGDQGRVVAFEPEPQSFEFLRRNVEFNKCSNVILEEKALSDKPGNVWLYIADTNKGGHSFFESPERSARVKVQALPLDEYLKGMEGEIDLVKIDTEGAEGIILEGMRDAIQTRQRMSIVLEFTPGVLREGGRDPAAFFDPLLDSDYKLYVIDSPSGSLVPVTRVQIPKLVEMLETARAHVNVLLKRDALSP